MCVFQQGPLAEAIKRDFGSYEAMVSQLSAISLGVQGSGWGWLGYDKKHRRLALASCGNQDPLQAVAGKRIQASV